MRLWDADSGRLTATLHGHSGGVSGVAFAPDGRQLASAGGDRTVRLWDADGGQLTATLEGHTARVTGVAFAPDGRQLASAGEDGTVRLSDADTGAVLCVLKLGLPMAAIAWATSGIAVAAQTAVIHFQNLGDLGRVAASVAGARARRTCSLSSNRA